MGVEELAELLHDRYCQGGRCGRLDRRGCWSWTSGRWRGQASELLAELATGHRVRRIRPASRERVEQKGGRAA